MKKLSYIFATTLLVISSTIIITHSGIAAGSEPGGANDPVVSKSYVDARISELKALIGNTNSNNTISSNTNNSNNTSAQINEASQKKIVEEVLGVIEVLYGDKLSSETTKPEEPKDKAFEPVNLLKGKYLIGGEGAEIIFRSGKAQAYSENEMGLIDVSSGTELFNGANLSPNHLLIVGRKDGRGVYAVEDSWITIKGSYTIK